MWAHDILAVVIENFDLFLNYFQPFNKYYSNKDFDKILKNQIIKIYNKTIYSDKRSYNKRDKNIKFKINFKTD